MNIHTDKIESAPPHALLLSDVRRILQAVPPDWIGELTEVRLANSLEYYSPYAFFSRYDGCLTIYSRRGTKKQALLAVLSALAAPSLGIKTAMGRRFSEADKHRIDRLIQPVVEELLPVLTPQKKLNAWHPVPFPDDPA